MHTWEKSLREDKFIRKNPNNPSFSSTLLDEIYRSIDKKEGENQVQRCNGVREKINNPIEEDEEMGSLRRACLIDKWMEKKVNEKKIFTREVPFLSDFEKDSLQDNDPLFFSSSSISSDSSSGGFSSSDTEFFSAAKTRTSCFASSWPKPIRTKVSSHENQNVGTNQAQKDNLIKSRSRAVKIYTNLKNIKQPISPGGRLTSFINSLFTNGSSKTGHEGAKKERKSKSTQTSACSSTTSFSRSCLSKTPSTTSRSKLHQNNAKRTVSFIVDEMESRTQLSEDMKLRKMEGLKGYKNHKKDDFVVERSILEDEDDAASDCSSDLFEIDHLVLFGNKRFCEELPVYETTYLDKNLAIATGLVR